jgi:hypothetical protein
LRWKSAATLYLSMAFDGAKTDSEALLAASVLIPNGRW